MKILGCILGCCLLLINSALSEDDELLVKVKNGILQGHYSTLKSGRSVRAFLGVPYAEPPIGDLRFRPPVAPQNWDGIRNCSNGFAICPQKQIFFGRFDVIGDEDCLYLYVYSPKGIETKSELLPVMVYLHGGGFQVGSGNAAFNSPDYLLEHDIVLVTLNYRLGPLGFLTTGDVVVPGNMALKDQVMALKWIQDNIKHFGGDPKKVTLFGHSAGAALAHMHILSPKSKGLINNCISQSGCSLAGWSVLPTDLVVSRTRKLANIMNCPTTNNEEMINCLRKADAKVIIDKMIQFLEWDVEPLAIFSPVVEVEHEGAFLTKIPEDILKLGKANDVSWIIGQTTEDGALRTAAFYYKPELMNDLNTNFNRIIPKSLYFPDNTCNPEKKANEIRQYYFGDKKLQECSHTNLTNMYTDFFYFIPQENSIDLHLKYLTKPVYYYLFEFKGATSLSVLLGDPSTDYGVIHGDDMQYLFPHTNFFQKELSKDGEEMVKRLTKMWVNFAKYGNPTKEGTDVEWKPVQTNNHEYLDIKSCKEMSMSRNMCKERKKFWLALEKKHSGDKCKKVEL